jgi:hypothetical protein
MIINARIGYNVRLRYNQSKGGKHMSIPNDELDKIIKKLNDDNKVVAKSFLSWLLEKQINDDDEYLSSDDIQALIRARKELEAGETTSMEDLKRELEL